MTILQRLLREPLFHFTVIGVVVFGLYSALSPPAAKQVNQISVGPEQIEQLQLRFEDTRRRQPTADELAGLIENFVRSEIYYRSALALGLDRNDAVIRQRLRQKMEFLSDARADRATPTDAELEDWLTTHPDTYRQDSTVALQQVYLGTQISNAEVQQQLDLLRQSEDVDFVQMGQRSLLPPELDVSRPQIVDNVFGQGFFETVSGLPLGEWDGPVVSGFGAHLVRVTEFEPGRVSQLAEVRTAVARDWAAEQSKKAVEATFSRLRQDYVVTIDGMPAPDVARP